MRDAVALEARGVPTVILVNDVFKPIAHATQALLGLPADYVEKNIVWLPHPTSNKSKDVLDALIDERIEEIRAKLVGRRFEAANGRANGAIAAKPAATQDGAAAERALAAAREAIAGLAASLRADGAELLLDTLDDGVLHGTLRIGELTCEDGSCILPAPQLARMVEALVKPVLGHVEAVYLSESKD
jgi:hypothetical protein